MEKQTPSKKSAPKPTPRGLPTLKELDKLMTGVDLWEMDKPPEVVAKGAARYADPGLPNKLLWKGD